MKHCYLLCWSYYWTCRCVMAELSDEDCGPLHKVIYVIKVLLESECEGQIENQFNKPFLIAIAGRHLLPGFSYLGFHPRLQTAGFITGHFNHSKSALFFIPFAFLLGSLDTEQLKTLYS